MTKIYILSVIAAGGLILTGCANDLTLEQGAQGGSEAGRVSATISLGLDTGEKIRTGISKAGDIPVSQIGRGEKIDKLVYAVYMVDEATGDFVLDTPLHPVQTVMPVDFSDNKRYTFTVDNLIADKEYRFAFWAQNSGCDAYDATDLSCVVVKYKDANGRPYANNDESRDAFCQVWSGSFSSDPEKNLPIEVILTRPLAQINVGTTGADYKTSAHIPGGTYYTYSSIELKGAADRIDVVNKRAYTSDEAKDALTVFALAPIAAYISSGVPALGSELPDDKDNPFLYGDNEHYLTIDLNRDGEVLPFLTNYNTIKKNDNGEFEYLTETFKYLSMAYVAVPFSTDNNGATTLEAASTLPQVKISFSNNAEGKELTAANTNISLTNVPARKNWRTNIIGGLYAPYDKDPNNPGNPDDPNNPGSPDDPNNPGSPDDPNNPGNPEIPYDPSSLFNGVKCFIEVSPAYFNENNIPDINEFQTK